MLKSQESICILMVCFKMTQNFIQLFIMIMMLKIPFIILLVIIEYFGKLYILIKYIISLGHFSGCGVTGSIKHSMEKIQYSGDMWNIDQQQQLDEERPAYKYSRQAASEKHHGSVRIKRATKPKEERNTCSLFIQTDPLLWKHIKEQVIIFFVKFR